MRHSLALALALLAGCGGGHGQAASTATQAPPAAATGAPEAGGSATPVPVHVRGAGTSSSPTVLTQTNRAGRKIYTIRALAFEGDTSGGRNGSAILEQPHITFVDKDGSVTIADAPKATVKQADNSVLMTGGVHARAADGGILTCDRLRYDAHSEKFYGDGHVVLTGTNGLTLTGDAIAGDVRLHQVRVTENHP